jgi:hypothetical protein
MDDEFLTGEVHTEGVRQYLSVRWQLGTVPGRNHESQWKQHRISLMGRGG